MSIINIIKPKYICLFLFCNEAHYEWPFNGYDNLIHVYPNNMHHIPWILLWNEYKLIVPIIAIPFAYYKTQITLALLTLIFKK